MTGIRKSYSKSNLRGGERLGQTQGTFSTKNLQNSRQKNIRSGTMRNLADKKVTTDTSYIENDQRFRATYNGYMEFKTRENFFDVFVSPKGASSTKNSPKKERKGTEIETQERKAFPSGLSLPDSTFPPGFESLENASEVGLENWGQEKDPTLKIPFLEFGKMFLGEGKEIICSVSFLNRCLNFHEHIEHLETSSSQLSFNSLTILHEQLRLFSRKNAGYEQGGPAELFGMEPDELQRLIQDVVLDLKKHMPNMFEDVPGSRKSMTVLEKLLQEKLKELHKSPNPFHFSRVNIYFAVAFHEVLRQVMIQGSETARVLVFLWNTYFSQLHQMVSKLARKAGQITSHAYEKVYQEQRNSEAAAREFERLLAEKEAEKNEMESRIRDLQEQAQRFNLDEKRLRMSLVQMKAVVQKASRKLSALTAEKEEFKRRYEQTIDLLSHVRNANALTSEQFSELMRKLNSQKSGISPKRIQKGITKVPRSSNSPHKSGNEEKVPGEKDGANSEKEEVNEEEQSEEEADEEDSLFDVNYDPHRDPDFLEFEEMKSEAQGHEIGKTMSIEQAGSKCQKCAIDKFDKYTCIETEVRRSHLKEAEEQTELILIKPKYNILFENIRKIDSAVVDCQNREKFMKDWILPMHLDRERVRVDSLTEGALIKNFDQCIDLITLKKSRNEAKKLARKAENETESILKKGPSMDEDAKLKSTDRLSLNRNSRKTSIKEIDEIEEEEKQVKRRTRQSFTMINSPKGPSEVLPSEDINQSIQDLSMISIEDQIQNDFPLIVRTVDEFNSTSKKVHIYVNGKRAIFLNKRQKNEKVRDKFKRTLRLVFFFKQIYISQMKIDYLMDQLSQKTDQIVDFQQQISNLKESGSKNERILAKIKEHFGDEFDELMMEESSRVVAGLNQSIVSEEESEEEEMDEEMEEETFNGEVQLEEDTGSKAGKEGKGPKGRPRKNTWKLNRGKTVLKPMKKKKRTEFEGGVPSNKNKAKVFDYFQGTNGQVLLEKAKNKRITKKMHLLPTSMVLKYVSIIYKERMEQNREKPQVASIDMGSFVYSVLQKQYGKSQFLEQKFITLVLSVRKSQQVMRVATFSRFLGVQKGPLANYSLNELKLYTDALDFFQTNKLGVSIPFQESSTVMYVPFSRAMEYFKHVSERSFSPEEISSFRDDVSKLKEKDTEGLNSFGIINVDLFMHKLILKNRSVVERTKKYVISAFKAADLDGNGTIEAEEFSNLWKYLNPERFKYFEADRIFRRHATLDQSGVLSVDFDRFAKICFEENLFQLEKQYSYVGATSKEDLVRLFGVVKESWTDSEKRMKEKLNTCKEYDAQKTELWLAQLKKISDQMDTNEPEVMLSVLIIVSIIESETRELYSLVSEHNRLNT